MEFSVFVEKKNNKNFCIFGINESLFGRCFLIFGGELAIDPVLYLKNSLSEHIVRILQRVIIVSDNFVLFSFLQLTRADEEALINKKLPKELFLR